ncbi:MAG TPA: S8 family serine peptidase [Casimicrobiaceae bacterium]|nr:S8 family serine peptidase [Casimicrobiaceae bacterium]
MRLVTALLRLPLALVLLGLAVSARCEETDPTADTAAASRELLVMLRLPPPHYRPDADYLGGYARASGGTGRKRVAEELAARFNLRVVGSYPMPALGVDCFVMEAPENLPLRPLIEGMASDSRVESVQAVNLFRVLSHDDPLFPLQPTAALWHLDELHQVATGKSVRVAAIDSGVELDHPDLRGRIVVARNFVDARDAVAEVHGTAVAGIIAARADDGIGIVGVAPEAGLMALRACWQLPGDERAAVCSSFTLAKALQFALDNSARVINLSLGGPRDRLLERLIAAAALRGIVVVAAADPRSADGGFPASLPSVLAVAGDDVQDASATTYLAPGRDVPATLPGRKWGLVGGSSYAAAEVAGLVALLIDAAPEQNPQQIREKLSTPDKAASTPHRGALVDACAAVARTVGACACGCRIAHGVSPAPLP